MPGLEAHFLEIRHPQLMTRLCADSDRKATCLPRFE